ncbi:Tfp pilus assembly protein FimT/FimU [Luteimonas sp. BDR2-5]|uniref:GspH/FimT family pseudopilin n=1 Tax=Proluteimonas luteida TaxID=2878685 RepID=UPI001E3455B3|nr:Tfp pilus assembly protein FimT/FimU [Luteimonas sp. BDR2-5]MCD9029785.1 Tfp pilus assembly protein FimT/FimU [Luteimonas sp. BDR2-5]
MRRTSGFTLIELMIALAIAAITLTIGMPAFSAAIERNRVQTALHLVSADLAMARSTAVMRRDQVVVCPRTPDARCRDDMDWSFGWIVFTDSDGNRQPDQPGDLLRVSDPPAGASNGALQLSATRKFLRYQRDGRSAGTNLTVRVCAGGKLNGEVVVNNLGRVRSQRHAAPPPCPA